MKLKNGILIDNRFSSAVNRLLEERVPAKVAYNLRAVVKELPGKIELFHETKKSLFDRFCKKQEDGTLLIESDRVVFIDEEAEKDFQKEMESLCDTEFEVSVNKVKLPDDIRISTLDLMILEPILEE